MGGTKETYGANWPESSDRSPPLSLHFPLMILRGPKGIWAPTPLFCAPVLETVCELEGHESRVFKSVFSQP